MQLRRRRRTKSSLNPKAMMIATNPLIKTREETTTTTLEVAATKGVDISREAEVEAPTVTVVGMAEIEVDTAEIREAIGSNTHPRK